MSGPLSASQVKAELGGFFVSCPIGLVDKASSPSKFHIIRDLSYHNKDDGYSVNDHLDSDDFPTEWGTASQVAEIVCSLSSFSSIYFSRCRPCAYMHRVVLFFFERYTVMC
jgi:hypothetical protein